MSPEIVLEISEVSLSFGGIQALNEVSLSVKDKEILSIIGPNGAGKTCLLNCLNGFYKPSQGEIIFKGHELNKLPPHKIAKLGVARTFQNIELYEGLTTVQNLMAGRHIHMKSGALAGMFYFGTARREEIEHRRWVEEVIDFLEIEEIRYELVANLSYGMRKRVELGRALASEPEILLMDEPMGGMNMDEKGDMARFIIDILEVKHIPVVLVEHDMDVVMDISNRVVVLEFGLKVIEDIPQKVCNDPNVIRAYLGE